MHRSVRHESLAASFHLLRAALSKDSFLSTRDAIAFSALHLLPLSPSSFTVCEHFSTPHVYVCWILTLGVDFDREPEASCLLENVTVFLLCCAHTFVTSAQHGFLCLSCVCSFFLMLLVVMVKAITHLLQQ